MKTKQFIDRQRVLNLATAAKIVSYAPSDIDEELSDEVVTDQVRNAALNYLINEMLGELGLNAADVMETMLVDQTGEPVRFAKEATNIGLAYVKARSAMKEDKND